MRRRHQRLAQDLATENPLHAMVGRSAAEDILLDLLKVQKGQELLQRRSGH